MKSFFFTPGRLISTCSTEIIPIINLKSQIRGIIELLNSQNNIKAD